MGVVVWQTFQVPENVDEVAPDGSEIRLLPRVKGGNMAHCLLPAGHVSRATRHHSIEEVWFCFAGRGELWRRDASGTEIVALQRGVAVSIPPGVEFQFRTLGYEPLQIVITAMPPWPGPAEATLVDGIWQPSLAGDRAAR